MPSPYCHQFLAAALWLLPLVTATVFIYPATPGIPTNQKFNISIVQSGARYPSPVYMTSSDGRKRQNYTDYGNRTMSWTSFAFNGASVTVEVLTKQSFNKCLVRPKSYGYSCVRIADKKAQFKVTATLRMMSVEFDNDYGNVTGDGDIQNKLMVFADPPETIKRNESSSTVLYYGPGVHNLSGQYQIPNTIREVYLAPGAWVKGGFKVTASLPVKIFGRGVIDTSGFPKKDARFDSAMISLAGKGNHVIEGLVLSDSMWFYLRGLSPNNTVRNVKTVGAWMSNTDGVVVKDNGTVEDSFFHADDDAIKLYYSGVKVQRCVVWTAENGAVFQTGWDQTRIIDGVLVSDVDVIHTDWCAFRRSQCKGMSDNNAVFNNQARHSMIIDIKNLTLRNIRVEGNCPRIIFWQMFNGTTGIASDVRLVNWTVESQPSTAANRIAGTGTTGNVTNWCFGNFRLGGVLVSNNGSLRLQIDERNTKNIKFSSSCP